MGEVVLGLASPVSSVVIGGDGVGWESVCQCQLRHLEAEGCHPVSQIEQDSPGAGLVDGRMHSAMLDDRGRAGTVAVGNDVARPQQRQLLLQGPVRRIAESVENRTGRCLGPHGVPA